VETAVTSLSGDWMATVDGRHGDEHFRGEVYLKIWWWDRKAGSWILNTRIDRPHGLMKVTAIAFNPSTDHVSSQLVTTGSDGNVKLWRIRCKKRRDGESEGELH
jgi:NET1-associated nuclear protein 1 (U3 small nucleolar RNA-associated protein 17)